MMKRYAVIVAGGSGTRMNSAIPKQFLNLKGTPVLMHTLMAFYQCDAAISIILVLPSSQISFWQQLIKQHHFDLPHQIVAGGKSRFQSVKNGLNAIPDDGLVAVHDGVRPLVSHEVINNAYQIAADNGAAITVVPSKDSIRVKTGASTKSVDRSQYMLVQTPQTFQVAALKMAYQQKELSVFTDDASVYEHTGRQVALVEGSYKNIKITTPEDLVIAEVLM